jgi:hypothetical protein
MKFRSWPLVLLGVGALGYEQKISENNLQVCSGMYGGNVPYINGQSRL